MSPPPSVTAEAIAHWRVLFARIQQGAAASRVAVIEERIDGAALHMGELKVIVSVACELDGHIWAHVSASAATALPGWLLMKRVKRVILGDEACAVMVLPPASKHVNIHPYVHHIWSRLDGSTVPDFTQGGATI